MGLFPHSTTTFEDAAPTDYEKAKAKPFPDMADLSRLIAQEPLLNHYWHEWYAGAMSFEQMLIAALVGMTEQKKQTAEALLKTITTSNAKPFTFPV